MERRCLDNGLEPLQQQILLSAAKLEQEELGRGKKERTKTRRYYNANRISNCRLSCLNILFYPIFCYCNIVFEQPPFSPHNVSVLFVSQADEIVPGHPHHNFQRLSYITARRPKNKTLHCSVLCNYPAA